MSFAIGQRWISETENSLGLGMITALDFRSVTLHFPATDETRIYAVAQAPSRNEWSLILFGQKCARRRDYRQ